MTTYRGGVNYYGIKGMFFVMPATKGGEMKKNILFLIIVVVLFISCSTEPYNKVVRPVSVWSGKVYEYETEYNKNTKKGFEIFDDKGNLDTNTSLDKYKTEVIANANAFVSWFSTNFLDTKYLTINEKRDVDNYGNSRAQVVVSSADGLTVLPLVKDYFYARCLIECEKYGNNGSYFNIGYCYYYMADGFDVVVDIDIDFANKDYVPMQKSIEATIDFQGHIVKNIRSVSDKSDIYLGLFAKASSVSNLIIEKAYIEASGKDSSVGALAGYFEKGKLKNITVRDSIIKGTKYTGGIAGQAYCDITNCAVENCTILTTTKEVGGLVGIYKDGKLSGCTVSGCTIKADKEEAGGLVGRVLTESEPYVENNTIVSTKVYVGNEDAKIEIGSKANKYLGQACGRVCDANGTDIKNPELRVKDNTCK